MVLISSVHSFLYLNVSKCKIWSCRFLQVNYIFISNLMIHWMLSLLAIKLLPLSSREGSGSILIDIFYVSNQNYQYLIILLTVIFVIFKAKCVAYSYNYRYYLNLFSLFFYEFKYFINLFAYNYFLKCEKYSENIYLKYS